MAKKIVKYDVLIKSTKQTKQWDIPKFFTNDLNSVVFQFVVSDLTVEEQATATAITMIYMRDGSFFQNPPTDVEKVGNTFSYTLKENEGNHAGIAKIQLVVTIPAVAPALPTVYASQLYEFEIINGLETKVAQEVMIYDWTTLTRDAQDYIDLFIADELLRDAEFDNAQFDRTTAFNIDQTQRVTDFNVAEAARVTAFNIAHDRAGTDHTTALNDSSLAATARTNAATDRNLAATDHTRADADHTQALANNTTVAGFNARVVAEENATSANKISTVKAKTFADVDARLEDLETDGSFMGTNILVNGDFSNGGTGWSVDTGTFTVSNKVATVTGSGGNTNYRLVKDLGAIAVIKDKYYARITATPKSALVVSLTLILRDGEGTLNPGYKTLTSPTVNVKVALSAVIEIATNVNNLKLLAYTNFATASDASGKVTDYENALLLNLTTIFGKGNEPTVEQMDEIMNKFTNSWFDGTKNLFRAKEALTKQVALDARTEFDAKNKLTIGDIQTTLPIGTSNSTNVQSFSSYLSVSKYYLSYRIVSTGTTNTRNTPAMTLDDNTFIYQSEWTNYNATTGIKSWAFTSTKPIKSLNWWGHTLDVPTVVDKFVLIDLTATFGAGKEPTQAEMDRLMARYPNSWFDGTKPIQTIETLYQEKANKVQEAWITPTLLNGWTNYGTDVLKMYKDEFGIVHIRGRVRGGLAFNPIITLPAGYRPAQGKYASNVASIGAILASTRKIFMLAAQGGTDNRLFIFDGLSSDWTHAESFLAIDISYRAEA